MESSFRARARARSFASTLSAVAAFAGSSGCTALADEQVDGRLDEVVITSSSALSGGDITALYGTYGAACAGRVGGEMWAVGANGTTNLAHPVLSVRKNDADCVLSLSEIVSPMGSYVASVEHSLVGTFAPSPTVFSSAAAEPEQILVNARLSAVSFVSDFGLTLVLSVAPGTASATKIATRAATYEWSTGPWMGCDATCGPGTDTRDVSCIDTTTQNAASESMCDAARKPASTEGCEDTSHCI